MAEILVETESEDGHGWAFDIAVQELDQRYEYAVTLSWADYDLWCRGRSAPQRVVQTIFEFLLEREPATAIFCKFDCALVRRYFPEVDRVLPGMI